jgi:phosphonate transport system ATP-binding protein
MISLRDETVGYNGRAVLRSITLSIGRGERVALVGESGAGKSTLLRLIYDRCRADAALIPQELGLVRSLTVFHNVYMGRLNRNSVWRNLRNLVRPAAVEVKEVRGVLARLAMEDKLFAPIEELSGGQQQRTAIGRALYQGGAAILGDEPVSAVDERQSRAVLDAIVDNNSAVVLAMHDIALALDYTDRIVGLRDGRVMIDAPTAGMKPDDLDELYRV